MAAKRQRGPGQLAGEANVAAHVQLERELRGWSTAELARQVTAAGCPLSQSAVWRIENGEPPRKISVDELVAFAKVFGKPIEQLLEPVDEGVVDPLIRLFLREWIVAKKAEMDAGNDLFSKLQTVLSAYWDNPAALQRLEDDLSSLVAERRVSWMHEFLMEDFRAGMAEAKKLGRPQFGPNAREIIIGYRALGKTDVEILDEAARWGMVDEVTFALDSGKVRMGVGGQLYSVPLAELFVDDGVIVWPSGPRPEALLIGD
ncbi:helix-turn-helix domain-containing protein [Streptomyces sp. H27-H1]|uniref:helix-turn-helix domain-containing protein n=1 Tax=Streptomyces sp. H27-H1 TaxID=2996461 RepID=UPI0022708B58|nr:helix-turn-helix domain-containing protein [Streptomyces sp. H27-H1]MCY0926924.1 helix-turn-helix domain-containing protein [Streptomyces sp. H27-H1]